VWCIYGYSLTIFIPMAFVCIVPIGWVRWLVVGLATGGCEAAWFLESLQLVLYNS
jgi:hypothetical protein